NWMVVRCMQPNDLGITGRRFRKQVSIRSHQVGELHLRLVGIPPWTQDMPYEVDRPRRPTCALVAHEALQKIADAREGGGIHDPSQNDLMMGQIGEKFHRSHTAKS